MVYSFYQFEHTGEAGCAIYSGEPIDGKRPCAWQGPILPTSNPFYTSFTGYYSSPSILEGYGVGFVWRVADDYRIPVSYRLYVSGNYAADRIDATSSSVEYSGNLFPLSKDESSCSVEYSGDYTSGMWDQAPISLEYSGNYQSGDYDVNQYSIDITGKYLRDNWDQFPCSIDISGNYSGIHYDISYFSCEFSGELVGKPKDIMSMNCFLSQITYAMAGAIKLFSGHSDTGRYNILLSKVIYQKV